MLSTSVAISLFYLPSLVLGSNLVTLKLPGPASLPIDASKPLHPSLGSFSIETAFFEEYIGNTTSPNQLTKDLLSNLVERTGVPAEIRIGGITADSTIWNATQEISLLNFIDDKGALQNTTIGPGFWDSIKLLPKGTKVILNLNLHTLNYTNTLAMAEAALKSLGPEQLDLLEIGNEPDHYLSFTPQNYTAIWEPWAKNISETLGFKTPRFQVAATAEDILWPYDSPAAPKQLNCVSALAAGADKDGVVRSCSEHTYQYSVCDPPRIVVATLPNLVNHTRLAQYLDLWQPQIKSMRDQLGSESFVVGEYNSVSCSGKDGVSNTFGQAMWLLDTTLYAASLNVSRLYIHQGGPLALQSSVQLNHGGLSFYNQWYPVENLNGPVKVFPSYSAYLFVTEAIGRSKSLQIANIYPGRQANGSSITTQLGDTSQGQLVAYGFWDTQRPSGSSYPTKLALINMEIYNVTQAAQGVARPNATFDFSAYLDRKATQKPIKIRRLTAPGADVKEANITLWAGQEFSTGKPKGKIVEEIIRGGKVDVPASEAVLLFL
jgi:hypothetical protein